MLDPKLFDELVRRVGDAIPSGLRGVPEDLEKNLRTALAAALRQLDLVTREEFDVQQALLVRTRLRLEALEQRVAALETEVLGETAAATGDNPDADMDGG